MLQSHPHQNYSICKLASHVTPSIRRECTGHVDTNIRFCLAFILLFVDLKISILILYLIIKLALLVQFSLPGINESEVLPKSKVRAEFTQMVLPSEASAGYPHPLLLPPSSYLVLMVLQACRVSCLWAFIQAVLSLSEIHPFIFWVAPTLPPKHSSGIASSVKSSLSFLETICLAAIY